MSRPVAADVPIQVLDGKSIRLFFNRMSEYSKDLFVFVFSYVSTYLTPVGLASCIAGISITSIALSQPLASQTPLRTLSNVQSLKWTKFQSV